MHRLLLIVGLLISTAACLTTVDQRWCDSTTPCSAGFVCTSTFHCIPGTQPRDAGTGGGGGSVGGGGGGSMGGGGGGRTGGGGGSGGGGGARPCDSTTCSGCCQGSQCIAADQQSQFVCGVSGRRCEACPNTQMCTRFGGCMPNVITDAGIGGPGSPCQNDSQCGSDGLGQCSPDVADWPGGYCTRSCEADACPAGAECIEADSGGQPVFICLAGCQSDGQCRVGYTCATIDAAGVCIPE